MKFFLEFKKKRKNHNYIVIFDMNIYQNHGICKILIPQDDQLNSLFEFQNNVFHKIFKKITLLMLVSSTL